MPTDFLEIPQPSHTRGFLKLAEEARNGCVGYRECHPVDADLPQVTGTTKPVVVTIEEFSHTSSQQGALIAPPVSSEEGMPAGPAEWVTPAATTGPVDPYGETVESVSSEMEPEDIEVYSVGPVGPSVTLSPVGSAGRLSQCDSDQPVADGPVGPSVTPSPVFNPSWTGRSISPEMEPEYVHVHSAGPVGPYFTLSLVGSAGRLSQCDSDQLVADGPVGPSVTPGPVGPSGHFPSVTRVSRWASRSHLT